MKKKIVGLLLTAAMVASLAACGGQPKDGGEQQAPEGDEKQQEETGGVPSEIEKPSEEDTAGEPEGIQEGTEITVAWDSDKETHLPWTNTAHGTIYMLMYDTLFQTVDGETSGLIADTWEISEDGLQYVIKIHDNIDFCNKDGSKGNHINAETVVTSLNHCKDNQASFFNNISGIEATGEYEITVTFSAPYADFMVQFSNPVTGIVDPAAVDQYGDDSNDAAVGSGPYYLESYEANSKFVFKANPYYWDAERMPHIETVNAVIITDESTAQNAIQTGEVGWIESSEYMVVEHLTADGKLASFKKPSCFNPLYFNCNKAPFDKQEVREAIGLLIDSDAMVELAYDGQGKVINNAWNEECATYVEYPNANVYDPERGLQMLKDAGVDPSTLVIHTYHSFLNASYMPTLQAQLAEHGITLEFETIQIGAFLQQMSTGDWDCMAFFGMLTDADPYAAYRDMLSEDGIYRILYIDQTYPELHAQVQELLKKAGECAFIEDQFDYLKEIDKLLADNTIWTTNVQGSEFIVYNSKIANMRVDAFNKYATMIWELYWTE